jgi:hypothetical protein
MAVSRQAWLDHYDLLGLITDITNMCKEVASIDVRLEKLKTDIAPNPTRLAELKELLTKDPDYPTIEILVVTLDKFKTAANWINANVIV